MFGHLQEYSDPRDADEAIRYLNGKDFEGSRLVVEFARRVRDRAPKHSEDAVRCLTFALLSQLCCVFDSFFPFFPFFPFLPCARQS